MCSFQLSYMDTCIYICRYVDVYKVNILAGKNPQSPCSGSVHLRRKMLLLLYQDVILMCTATRTNYYINPSQPPYLSMERQATVVRLRWKIQTVSSVTHQ